MRKSLKLLRQQCHHISSIGFSGAGFLISYHMGVAKCLLDHGLLLTPKAIPGPKALTLLGVSAGALVSAAVSAGVDPVAGMDLVLAVSEETRRAGRLDTLQPGYSLIDAVEGRILAVIREACQDDEEYLLARIDQGRLLRIGLTDRRVFPPVGRNPRAVVYVDRYRGIQDVVAAAILSSYVPGVTGPAWGSLDARNGAVNRAATRLKDMIKAGCVKKGSNGEPLTLSKDNDARELLWDGGLVNAFPYLDDDTVIVSPLGGLITQPTINPSSMTDTPPGIRPGVRVNPRVFVHWSPSNAAAMRDIAFSSDDQTLENYFSKGYDNAHLFLDRNNLLMVHQRTTPNRLLT